MSSQPVLSLREVAAITQQYQLLHEIILPQQPQWTIDIQQVPDISITHITYDTRNMRKATLLFIKGNFNPRYLQDLDTHGLVAYVAQQDYSEYINVPGIIVDDVYAAMARISAEFYGHPEQELTILGITGTKGKTTTAFLTFALLQQCTDYRVGLLSSESLCVDGTTMLPSHLTTPESLDSLRMMREARNHGITHLVMEISSQAYKIGRVIGIHFASAAFLNISPDHISPIEHPTFENYLYCKRQIIRNTDQLIVNADCDYLRLLTEDALQATVPITFCQMLTQEQRGDASLGEIVKRDIAGNSAVEVRNIVQTVIDADHVHFSTHAYELEYGGQVTTRTNTVLSQHSHLALLGEFNIANATVALALIHSVGFTIDHNVADHVLSTTRVPGRMERIVGKHHVDCIIDYAHNYLSVSALIHEVQQEYSNPYIIVVTGSTGGKALDRRQGIIEACQEGARAVVLTTDDSNFDDPQAIAQEMQSYITDHALYSTIIVDRAAALAFAVEQAYALREGTSVFPALDEQQGSDLSQEQPIVILAVGKGDEDHQVIQGRSVPYIGDRAAIDCAYQQQHGDEK